MQIVEFCPGTLRFLEQLPSAASADSFIWIFLERDSLMAQWPQLQQAAQHLGGSSLLGLHGQDLANEAHPSHYDYTSVYDMVIFRRLATGDETTAATVNNSKLATSQKPSTGHAMKGAFARINSRALGFAVFDRLLISVHPAGCYIARNFVDRYLADAMHTENASITGGARNRLPTSPADLMLRMVNTMVDSYLDLRKQLTAQLDHWQHALLNPPTRFNNWTALMGARNELHTLEDLCDEQHDAMQEWLDNLREQPANAMPQGERDDLVARSRDVIEHIERVQHHVHRLEQSAETVVQIHFSAQSNRTNDIMRILTALTAVFLPLNLITGFFGMNFENFPFIHHPSGLWWTIGFMLGISIAMGLFFWRKRYLARTRK